MASGRTERNNRLIQTREGAWASSSQDYLKLAVDLYELSSNYAKKYDGNVSAYPIAGIPLLISTVRALLIEANSGIFGLDKDALSMGRLAGPNEVGLITEKYVGVGTQAAIDIVLLYEVRNEIVHPAHTPAGTKHNTPVNMLPLRERGLLQSTGRDDCDYEWIAQLQSHRLFRWSFLTIEGIAKAVIDRHHSIKDFAVSHFKNYQEYRMYDL